MRIRIEHFGIRLMLLSASLLSAGCSGGDDDDDDGSPPSGPYTLTGTVQYDWVQATDGESAGESSIGLDYDNIAPRPARRIVVEAISTDDDKTVLASDVTDDQGQFTLEITALERARVRAYTRLLSTGYTPDAGSDAACQGASWDVRVVDNTSKQALYALESPTSYGETATVEMHAGLEFDNGYDSRDSAPFAIADTIVEQLELVCQGRPTASFPRVNVNWSPDNVPGYNSNDEIDYDNGYIGTSHYTSASGSANMYILGLEDVDTDEFDDHVIAHEFGHYLEDQLFRADNIGGAHGFQDSLDPRVAFGEGYGNAISGMVFNDPNYVDTNGSNQADGFVIPVGQAPVGDDQGVYSESSVQYFLWKLYDGRDATANSGSFDRIYKVLKDFHVTADAFTTVNTFAAFYNQAYGQDADGLKTLWSSSTGGLNTPYDALCMGTCKGTGDAADPFDVDNDIGKAYATTRRFPQGLSGKKYDADFWRLYRQLSEGNNIANGHDQTVFYSDYYLNKFGAQRWYLFEGTGDEVTFTASNPVGRSDSVSCGIDVLDMEVYRVGQMLEYDWYYEGPTSGCPTVTVDTEAGKPYVMTLTGYNYELSSWVVNVAR